MNPGKYSYLGLSKRGFHSLHYLSWKGLELSPQLADERTLVCVHALSRNCRDFDYLARDLARDRHIVCCDVVGRGKSQWLKQPELYGIPQYLSDLTALIARLDVKQIDFLGTSMGGLMGIAIAALKQTPIRRLIINDVGPFVPEKAISRIRGYLGIHPDISRYDEAKSYFKEIFSPFGPLTEEQWDHITKYSIHKDSTGKYRLNFDPAIAKSVSGSNFDEVNLWPLWSLVKCPVLLLRGKDSDVLPSDVVQKMRDTKPDLKVVEFDGVGHAPALISPEQINVVKDWLNNTPTPKAE